MVQADPLRIEQIIVNLLRNALDAVREPRATAEIKILLVQGETILLSIEDNGAGPRAIPTSCSSRSTPPRSPARASGLGLAISAGFAAELGGRLVARNAPDGGAVFELVLPREPAARPRPQSERMNGKSKVAIIDDEADMRESVAQWLQLSGFEPVTFEAAEPALKVARPPTSPGVVISDIRMPGMDGMALLRRLQSIDPGLPVILMTGHGDVPMAVEAMRIGAFDFVEKPFDPDRLTELCQRGRRGRAAAPSRPGRCAASSPTAAC